MSEKSRLAEPATTNDDPHSHGEVVSSAPERRKAGASWKEKEQQVLPENRLWLVFAGLMCCIFLAALDQVCLHHILYEPSLSPTIGLLLCDRPSLRLHYQPSSNISVEVRTTAGLAGTSFLLHTVCSSSFLVSSYLLAASALAPVYGKVSDLLGRKPILYFSIVTFLVCLE
jgi:MFS family permease